MSATDYTVDERDIKFVLTEQIGLDQLTHLEAFKDFTEEDLMMVISESVKQAKEIYGPANAPGDRQGCKLLDGGEVELPPETVKALEAYRDNGWNGMVAHEEAGGQGMPVLAGISTGEIFSGANVAMMMYPGLTRSGAHLIDTFCSEDLKKKFVKKMNEFVYQGTMCLTEPGAGTAVGDLKSTAKPNGDHYLIEGQKIFISCGENPMTENVIHLVLARAEGSPQGIKGISLFVVPKYIVNDDGSLGEKNDLVVSGLEHKMGINASCTCQLSFGDNGKCVGYLVGEVNQGIVYMFQMMNEARLSVGLQGVAGANAAYQNALSYARDRVQGTRAEDFKNVDAERVAIINHADISRMLMLQKAYAEGGRAFLYTAALWQDIINHGTDEKEVRNAQSLLDIATPILKAYYSDKGFEAAILAIQTYGGYGYIQEYPVEQIARDLKIASIYEGTNGIQALDLLGRKVGMKGGAIFMGTLNLFNIFIGDNKENPYIGSIVGKFEEAKNKLAMTTMNFGQQSAKGDMAYPVSHACDYLNMFGNLYNSYFLLLQATVAGPKLDAIYESAGAKDDEAKKKVLQENAEARFYDGKLKVASFFATNVLPQNNAYIEGIESKDTSVIDMVW